LIGILDASEFYGIQENGSKQRMLIRQGSVSNLFAVRIATVMLALSFGMLLPNPLGASRSSKVENSLSMSVDAPESDVLQALQALLEDQVIHGTQQYAKEKILYGAHSAQSSSAFDNTQETGKIFYKVAERVLAPTNFEESSALGTITVRYVVQPLSDNRTNIRVDAVYVENDRRTVHRSGGVVESAEYAEFKKNLEELQAKRAQEQKDSAKLAQLQAEDRALAHPSVEATIETPATSATLKQLEDRVQALRREVGRRVKAPGAELKSAPFRSASTISSLPAQTEVVVVVVTPYWLGVETTDGRHGWLHHSQLELRP
jgi:hypothetical protein